MNKLVLDILAALASIVTIIGVPIAVVKWIRNKRNKREQERLLLIEGLIKEIEEKTEYIERTFRPDDLRIDSSSTNEVKLLKDFQKSTLESVRFWKIVSTMEPISNLNSLNASELLKTKVYQLTTIQSFEIELNKTLEILKNMIVQSGKTNYLPRPDKVAAILTKQNKRTADVTKLNKHFTRTVGRLKKKYPSGSIPRKKIIKAVKPLDKYNTMDSTLDYLKDFYSFCVENNAAFMQSLNIVQ